MPDKKKYKELAKFGRTLLDETSYTSGLPKISEYAKKIIGAQRCSIFINDLNAQELWTTIADGMQKIVIPVDSGVVGQTISEKKPLIVNEPYKDPNFLTQIDQESGFITQNLATAPIFNSKREIIGVLELLNKDDGFDGDDIKFMIFFTHFISGFLELIDLCILDKMSNNEKV